MACQLSEIKAPTICILYIHEKRNAGELKAITLEGGIHIGHIGIPGNETQILNVCLKTDKSRV